MVAAVLAGSLSLLADAGHNLSDVVALGVAAGAVMLARRPATPNRSFGFKRAEILAALFNAVSLIVIAVIVFVGAALRFADPPDVPGGLLIVVASVGLLVNAIGAAAVFRRGGEDINLRAAYIHLVGDALGSIAVIVTGIVIVTTGWRYADPIMGVLIGVYLVVSSWGVLRESVLVLLESTPRGLDAEEIGRALAAQPGVVEVHDLHVWQITSGFPCLSAHVLVREGDDCHGIRRASEHMLRNGSGSPTRRSRSTTTTSTRCSRSLRRHGRDRRRAAGHAARDALRRPPALGDRAACLEIERAGRAAREQDGVAGRGHLRRRGVDRPDRDQKHRVVARAGPVLRAVAQDERSQLRNRELAIDRLVARLAEALRVERKRVPTKPSRAAKEQRLEPKKRRGATKRLRRVDDGE